MSWRQRRHVPCVGNADWGQPQLCRRAVRDRPQFADSFKGCDSIPLSGSQMEKPFHLLLSQGLYHCTGRKFVLPAREHGIRTHRVGLLCTQSCVCKAFRTPQRTWTARAGGSSGRLSRRRGVLTQAVSTAGQLSPAARTCTISSKNGGENRKRKDRAGKAASGSRPGRFEQGVRCLRMQRLFPGWGVGRRPRLSPSAMTPPAARRGAGSLLPRRPRPRSALRAAGVRAAPAEAGPTGCAASPL